MKFIAEKAGIDVDWDSETKTIILKQQLPVSEQDVLPYKDSNAYNNDSKKLNGEIKVTNDDLNIGDFKAENCYYSRDIDTSFINNKDIDNSIYGIVWDKFSLRHNPKSFIKSKENVKYLKGKLYLLNAHSTVNKSETVTLQIRANDENGEVLKDFKISKEKIIDFEVNIEGVDNICFVFVDVYPNAYYGYFIDRMLLISPVFE